MAAIIFFLLILAAPAEAYEFEARVEKVMDGDTFSFNAALLNISVKDTCRLLHYNAPERKGPEKAEGEKAKAYLSELIEKKVVRIRAQEQDKYKRWLCEVWAEGASVNERMRSYLKSYSGLDLYKRLEETSN